MKKLYTTASLLVFFSALSSFTPSALTAEIVKEGSSLVTVAMPVCNGDYVELQVKDDFVIRGMTNNNRASLRIKHHLTGKGVSILTGENYTLDTEIETQSHVPVTKGAMVLKDVLFDDVKGDRGSVQFVVFRSHITYNAAGKVTADHFDATVNCR